MRQVGGRALYEGLKAIGCTRAQGPPKGWRFRPLLEARANFERVYCAFDWDAEVIEWQPALGAVGKPPF